MADELRLTLLGLPHVALNGVAVTGFVSSKAQALLYYLAVIARPQSRQSLAALFWGDMPEAKARANLRVALFNLRRLFPDVLLTSRDQVAFNTSTPYWIDCEEFQRVLQADLGLSDGGELAVRAACELYQGEFLEGFHAPEAPEFEAWVLLERERLRDIALHALHQLTIYCTESGAYAQGIEYATRLLALDPWREEAHRQRMLLLALDGQRGAALAQYKTCCQILSTELGIAPLEQTTTLYERIRSAKLSSPAPRPADLAAQFVGRSAEHAWLVRQWAASQHGPSRLTLIEGPIGAGKTRMAEELLHYAESQGALILRTRCYEFSSALPYQPFADLLRRAMQQIDGWRGPLAIWQADLARLVPDVIARVGTAPGETVADETARQRLFEAAAQVLQKLISAARGRTQPLIMFIDDLQWADSATLDLLRYLVYRLQDEQLWFLGARRPQGGHAGHPLRKLQHALGREGRADLLQLGPLPRDAILSLVRSIGTLPGTRADQAAATLEHISGGNAFIMGQFIQDLAHSDARQAGWMLDSMASSMPDLPVPHSVSAMILDQAERLPPGALHLLQLATIAVPHLDTALIECLYDDRDATNEYLAHCLDLQLLVYQQPDSYSFRLELVRQVIYNGMPQSQRYHLHYKVIRACERLGRAQPPARHQPYQPVVLH